MSDQRLQRLRRAWDQGDLETQVLLRELIRAGELSEDRLELAAHLGSQAAAEIAEALSLPATPWHAGGCSSREPAHWASCSMILTDQEALVRVALAAARSVAGQELAGTPHLVAAEEWAACPCERHEEHARVVWNENPPNLAASAAALAAAWINPGTPVEAIRLAVSRATSAQGEQHVDRAIRDEVVPWALCLRDPVRERVEARQREA